MIVRNIGSRKILLSDLMAEEQRNGVFRTGCRMHEDLNSLGPGYKIKHGSRAMWAVMHYIIVLEKGTHLLISFKSEFHVGETVGNIIICSLSRSLPRFKSSNRVFLQRVSHMRHVSTASRASRQAYIFP